MTWKRLAGAYEGIEKTETRTIFILVSESRLQVSHDLYYLYNQEIEPKNYQILKTHIEAYIFNKEAELKDTLNRDLESWCTQ
jgi:hypothetical protein